MVSNTSSISAYKINAYSSSKTQTGAGAPPTSQQPTASTPKNSSVHINISQTGKTLASNYSKSSVDVTDVKAVAKQHLAQQKLAYEQKYGLTTASGSPQTNSPVSVTTDTAKAPVDVTDVKAVAKQHLAQQKLAYEQKYGLTAASGNAQTNSPVSATTDTAKAPVDVTDVKAVAKQHLAQQKLAYEQKYGTTTTAITAKQNSKAIGSYQSINRL